MAFPSTQPLSTLTRVAVGLLGFVALSAMATAVVNLDQPIAFVFATVVAALHVAAAWVVMRRNRNYGFTPTLGCLAYGFLVILALYDVPGGIYVLRHNDADPLPPILLGPILIAAPFASLSAMFLSPIAGHRFLGRKE
jgi:hypothetical protein